MFICDDWSTLKLDYLFEAYRINDDNTFTLVKNYDTPLEFGMALYSWDKKSDPEEVKPKVAKKWRGYTRDNPVPKKAVKEMSHKGVTELDDDLSNGGTITWFCDGRYWVYGEYFDSSYSLGY
jgi:hypothetical protein